MAPPLNDFLEKGVLRSRRKQVTIKVACLGIKENENGHGGWLRDKWGVHVRSVLCLGG